MHLELAKQAELLRPDVVGEVIVHASFELHKVAHFA